jgi:hypothetical protein
MIVCCATTFLLLPPLLKRVHGSFVRSGQALLVCLLAAGSAAAQDIHICLVPDTQNQAGATDSAVVLPDSTCRVDPIKGSCVGASCEKSPYCTNSWYTTGEILLNNAAYSMTGQWEKIDYSAIKGRDKVLSKQSESLDHPRCDMILGLGDMMDISYPPAKMCAPAVLDHAGTTDSYHQYEAIEGFWRIIQASGVPFLPLRGNHDPEDCFSKLMRALEFESLPFYYSKSVSSGPAGGAVLAGQSYAIKAEIAGKTFCAVGVQDAVANDVWPGPALTDVAFCDAAIGCGGNFPTILISHGAIHPTGAIDNSGDPTLGTLRDGCVRDPNNSEVFVVAGGHWTNPVTTSVKASEVIPETGKRVWKLFSNWQEMNRHNGGRQSMPEGVTPSDGQGGVYTVITISPAKKTICAHDWNPYFQTRSERGNGQEAGLIAMTELCEDFDFDERF